MLVFPMTYKFNILLRLYRDVRKSANKTTAYQDEESSKYFNTTIGFAICLSLLFLTLIIVVILKIIKFLKQKSIWFRKGKYNLLTDVIFRQYVIFI